MIKVKDEPNLVRDPNTGVIHNTNRDDYRSFVAKRQTVLETRNRIEKLEKDNAEIKDTLSQILQLLKDKQ